MARLRLDSLLVMRRIVSTRSQAESYIRLGKVYVDGKVIKKPGYFASDSAKIILKSDQYVSRAGLKLASIAEKLKIDFTNKVVLDVGSSTGGFTDFALRNGASRVIAVDVGTNQLHKSLRENPKIELHEQTDIRDIYNLSAAVDIVVIDISFISLKEVLPHIQKLVGVEAYVVAMCKPQFESGFNKHKGVIKNDKMRREILKDFEQWLRTLFVVLNKADSDVAGEKGNRERFYLLRPLKR